MFIVKEGTPAKFDPVSTNLLIVRIEFVFYSLCTKDFLVYHC